MHDHQLFQTGEQLFSLLGSQNPLPAQWCLVDLHRKYTKQCCYSVHGVIAKHTHCSRNVLKEHVKVL